MTIDDQRSLRLATWQISEAFVKRAAGDLDGEDYHILAARETLFPIAPDRVKRARSADDLAGICADIKDAAGLLF